MLTSIYKTYQDIYFRTYRRLSHFLSLIYFAVNGVKHGEFVCIGLPLLDIHSNAHCVFASGLSMVSKDKFATLGKNKRCKIVVSSGAKLTIGTNVGMSNTTIVATLSVELGNNILIGGGTTIVDTDFHSLNPVHWHTPDDLKYMASAPVVINDNVFIGMDSIILKGVSIGSNVIIAAGSVVTKNIPENQVWGGNPARFIKNNKT